MAERRKKKKQNGKGSDKKYVQLGAMYESDYDDGGEFFAPSDYHGQLLFKEAETGKTYKITGTASLADPLGDDPPENLQGNLIVDLNNPKKAKPLSSAKKDSSGAEERRKKKKKRRRAREEAED